MTSTSFTIDNPSPLLQYQPNAQWSEGDTVADPEADRYFGNATFTLSTTFGASMSFTFNGTSVIVSGAKRGNHGPYSVTIDGKTSNFDGFANPDIFQMPLFQADGLEQGMHTVTITNAGTDTAKPFLDIDFVKWNSTVQGSKTRAVEDDDALFQYTPSGAWSTDLTKYPGFSAGNGHVSNTPNALCSVFFEGDAVDLKGSVGPDHGSYTISVDGSSPSTFNATKSRYLPQQILFHADNLGPGQHTMKVTQKPTGNNAQALLAIDGVVITDFSQMHKPLSAGAIAGIVVSGIALLSLIAAGVAIWMRRRRRKFDSLAARGVLLDPSATSPIQQQGGVLPPTYETRFYNGGYGPGPGPASIVASTEYGSSSAGMSTQSSEQLRNLRDAVVGYNYASAAPRPDTFAGESIAGMSTASSDPSSGSRYAPRTSSRHGGSVSGGNAKQPRVVIPPASQQRLDHLSPDELRANRMVVPGREQDFGPVQPGTARLPPDYTQATEPYRDGPRPF